MQAAEVKRVIEWSMGNLDGCYAIDSVALAVVHGPAAAAAAEAAQESDPTVVPRISRSLTRNAPKIPLFQGRTNDDSTPNTCKNFR